jgi:hypothetical protein
VLLVVSLVVSAATSLQGAGRALAVLQECTGLAVVRPSGASTRLWLLRVGSYKLTRAKEHAEDWVWSVDHMGQLGAEKWLVSVGLRLSALPVAGAYLTQAEVEPSAICPVTQSNGEVVYQQLEEARKQTGVPREILSDPGSDLHKGIRQFCQAHPATCALYDIKHKVAAVWKRELEVEGAWQEFSSHATQTIAQVQQTALAALAPPRQRRKARDMTIAEVVGWGGRSLQ